MVREIGGTKTSKTNRRFRERRSGVFRLDSFIGYLQGKVGGRKDANCPRKPRISDHAVSPILDSVSTLVPSVKGGALGTLNSSISFTCHNRDGL